MLPEVEKRFKSFGYKINLSYFRTFIAGIVLLVTISAGIPMVELEKNKI